MRWRHVQVGLLLLFCFILGFNIIIPFFDRRSFADASPTQFERYNVGDDSAMYAYGTTWLTETFTVGNTGTNIAHYITGVRLKTYRLGSPGTCTVSIKATDGASKPTGGDLASVSVNGNTFFGTTASWYWFNFSAYYQLQAGTKYAIVIKAPAGSTSNWVAWRMDSTSSSYGGGTSGASADSGATWTLYSTQDFVFEEYGDGTAPISSATLIHPFNIPASPLIINATATDSESGMKNVSLWFRYSSNGGGSWGAWTNFGWDTVSPWSWSFGFPSGYGNYQFYTRAYDIVGNYETAPANADTSCKYGAWKSMTSGYFTFANTPVWKTLNSSIDLYERYNAGDDAAGLMGGTYWYTQTFTVGNTGMNAVQYVTGVKLKMYKSANPGTLTIGIRATDVNGKPTGSNLASGTFDGTTMTDSEPGAWYWINFTTPYPLQASTKYAIVCSASGSHMNAIFWRADITSPSYSGGSYGYSLNSGSTWTMPTSTDFMFEVYSKLIYSGYFTFANTPIWASFRSGWFKFSNASSWKNLFQSISGSLTVGNSGTVGLFIVTENVLASGKFQMGSHDGIAQTMSTYIYNSGTAKNTKCGIYEVSDENSYVGTTDQRTISGGPGWQTFTFSVKPTLIANTWYYLSVWSYSTTGTAQVYYATSGGSGTFTQALAYGNYPDPYFPVTQDADGLMHIYCSYNYAYTVNYTGYATFGNIPSWKNTASGYFIFSNVPSWLGNQGYFTFKNTNFTPIYDNISQGWFSFGNTSQWQGSDGYFTFANTPSWHGTDGYFTFNNIPSWNGSDGFFSFGNIPSWQGSDGYFNFSNTPAWKGTDGYFNFSNTPAWKGTDGYFNFGNVSASQTISEGYFTFDNGGWKNITNGYFTFSANLAWTNISEGYFTFSNSVNYTNIMQGYFNFSNTPSWHGVDKWFTFANNAVYNNIDHGWFSFLNIVNFQNIIQGYFNFLNTPAWHGIDKWFTFGNSPIYNNIDMGWFSFLNAVNYQNMSQGYFNFSNTPSWKGTDGYFIFNNGGWQSIEHGWFSFRNVSTWHTEKEGYFTFGNTSYMVIIDVFPFEGQVICPDCYEITDTWNLTYIPFAVDISHTNGTHMNITWSYNNSGVWEVFGQFTNQGNGSHYSVPSWNVTYDHVYEYKINVSDGVTSIEKVISFSTDTYTTCMITTLSPTQFSCIIMLILFIFLFWIGYIGEKRSAGAFMLISGLVLLGLIAVAFPYLPLGFVALLTSVAGFITLLGVNKWLIKPNMSQQKPK